MVSYRSHVYSRVQNTLYGILVDRFVTGFFLLNHTLRCRVHMHLTVTTNVPPSAATARFSLRMSGTQHFLFFTSFSLPFLK